MKVATGPKTSTLVSLVILAALLALFPHTPTLILSFFVLLAIYTKTKEVNLNMAGQSANENDKIISRVPSALAALPIIVVVFLFFFYSAKIIKAEVTFKKSLDALSANDGVKTYDNMRLAIQQNPTVDRYHASFSQINFMF